MTTKYSKKFKIVTEDGKILDTYRTFVCARQFLAKKKINKQEKLRIERI